MAAFQHLLQRLGFVKLGRFGLALTPDGRILSTRPAVLDDGAGGRIVGWEDRDLAVAELPSWQPVQHPALRAPAQRFVAPPAAPRRARPAAIPPALPAALQARPVPARASAAVMPPVVAAEPAVDEDDWEWTIALARARAEDPPEPVRPPPRAAAPRTLPMASVTATPRVARARPASVMPVATAPSTVIPVPVLPTVRGTANATRFAPVVRTSPAQQAGAPRRFPKGTGPHDPATAAMSDATTPSLAIGEHTRLGATPASAVGDQTQVGIALPPAARAVSLPSVKRRTSPR
jgi:hypothetical protein